MNEHGLIALQPGTVIAGRYEVVKCLGAGSMGLVYACRHRELSGHLVAVKVLFPEVAKDNVAAARFRNEIVASYGVSHPNVVRAYEYFRDGDLVAYTMEYVGGGDLADWLASGEPIPIQTIVRVMCQIVSGVQAIHDAGIVHRDLKPENILLTMDGDVKITDFGIARTGHGPKLTEHGGVVGTIDYVSPEYLEKGQVDIRSDIYAIGVLGYEMVAGRSPFKGDSVIATMTMRLRSDPVPPIQYRQDCPPKLNDIIMKAIERNPDLRYQSAMEMFHDLQQIEGSQSIEYVSPENQAIEPLPKTDLSERNKAGEGVIDRDDGATTDTTDMILSVPEMSKGGQSFGVEVGKERLDSVLSLKSSEDSIEEFGSIGSSISVADGRLDKTRIETLSQAVRRTHRRGWVVDMALMAVAGCIGIAVGVVALKFIWPDFFKYSFSYILGEEKTSATLIDSSP